MSETAVLDEVEKQRIRDELGQKIKSLRIDRGLTLKQASDQTNLAISTIYKIENGKVSPSFENLLRLARGYGVGLEQLIETKKQPAPTTRMTLTRAGEGRSVSGRVYDYEILCNSLTNKKIIPLLGTVEPRPPFAPGELSSHQGEELLLVLQGDVELVVEHYEPVTMTAGDSAYFDSTLKHGVRSLRPENAQVFWACTHLAE